MAMQQIAEMLGVNIFFSFPPSQLMLTRLWLQRCQQTENYSPAWKKPERGKKMTEEEIRSSCEYFLPAVREKKYPLRFVLLSGCDILHHLPSILPYPILKATAISHQHFHGRLLAVPRVPVCTGTSSFVLRALPLQSHSTLRRVLSGCCLLFGS